MHAFIHETEFGSILQVQWVIHMLVRYIDKLVVNSALMCWLFRLPAQRICSVRGHTGGPDPLLIAGQVLS